MRRFFCENCGEEVKENDELCPRCGAIFAAIKCPRCKYRGKVHEFRNGCPSCGFLGEDRVRATRQQTDEPLPEGTASFGKAKPRSFLQFLQFISGAAASTGKGPPGWLFWLIIIVMIGAFALLSVIYTSI